MSASIPTGSKRCFKKWLVIHIMIAVAAIIPRKSTILP
jgi:hypothetical protein